ncbi:MAG: PAS domain-containing protein [Candidatus Aminicenantes bacterium]|nr:PAS domain-containing protein [Candidatus Aminicenantes bacterium]
MNEEEKKTRFLRDLDRVRKQISEIETAELERDKKEQTLKEEKLHYKKLLEDLSLGILSVNVQGIIDFINTAALKILGIDSSQEIEKIDVWKSPVFVDSGISKGIRACLDTQKKKSIDSLYQDEKNKRHYFNNTFSPIFHKDGSINGVMVILEDITEERKNGEGLKQKLEFEQFISKLLSRLLEIKDSNSTLNQILEDIGEEFNADRIGLFLFDEDKDLINCSYEWNREKDEPQIDQKKNIPFSELSWLVDAFHSHQPIEIPNVSEITKTQESLKKFCLNHQALSFLGVPVFCEDKWMGFLGLEWISQPGTWTQIDLSKLDKTGSHLGCTMLRQRVEKSKRKANDRLCMLAQAGFEAIVILKSNIIIDANHAASSLFEYKPSEYLGKDLSLFFDSNEKKKIEKTLEKAKSQSIESTGIKKSGEVLEVEILTKTIFDENDKLDVLGIRDITGREQDEKNVKEKYESLRETLDETVKALAFSVELKDPYTAGHMQRVTRLACAMAEEMGLSEEKIQGLKIAASIHDIGKISIPSEILGKPDKLTEAERMIVESHPKAGYEILKNISFPWPVADIVLQHHERMNGSGYPKGLSVDQILLEARIIGVADVVEALTSRRHHRSAQEKDALTSELKKNKTSLYDPEAVDACLKIINKKSFSFQTFSLGKR